MKSHIGEWKILKSSGDVEGGEGYDEIPASRIRAGLELILYPWRLRLAPILRVWLMIPDRLIPQRD
ncbi:unnamed protein product [Dovyalis caffra]|uniref:Uncharacterized protein n=1 Tax=Dovyalis caffra TaxID=77055 RepID=A0AAV1QQ17_9ROSI|nr:unnamed protein product [Dovyalis caffra]